jgi:HD-GYP domain-containing protein (c-di-GMP phosphodiesterase class II)
MKRHPVIGCELLKDLPGISPAILDGVRHHHEYLDGSGYPDALTAPEISDLVRLLTISDIFAALIESRPYRPAMPRQDAYNILCAMDGKLERSLVKAFRNTADRLFGGKEPSRCAESFGKAQRFNGESVRGKGGIHPCGSSPLIVDRRED